MLIIKICLHSKGVDTDWMSLPLQNAFDHKHSVYIEGGTPNLRYGVDASYNGVNGVMKGSGRDRYSIGFSLDYRVKQLQVKIRLLLDILNLKSHLMARLAIIRVCNLMRLLTKTMEH